MTLVCPPRRDIQRDGVTRASRPVVAGLLVLVLMSTGCQKALFSPDEERSPYDRYDAIRAQRPPGTIEDEFGYKKPNVRGRLLDND